MLPGPSSWSGLCGATLATRWPVEVWMQRLSLPGAWPQSAWLAGCPAVSCCLSPRRGLGGRALLGGDCGGESVPWGQLDASSASWPTAWMLQTWWAARSPNGGFQGRGLELGMGSDSGKLVCDGAGSSVAAGPPLASVNLRGPLSVTTVSSCPHSSQSVPWPGRLAPAAPLPVRHAGTVASLPLPDPQMGRPKPL